MIIGYVDTDYHRLRYYPHYWIDTKEGKFVMMRTTNLRDKSMLDEQGNNVTGTYGEVYRLCRALNNQNRKLVSNRA